MIIFILIIALIYSLIRQFSFYCGLRGIIYYLITEYNDELNDKKIKELTSMAVKRTINELFKRN